MTRLVSCDVRGQITQRRAAPHSGSKVASLQVDSLLTRSVLIISKFKTKLFYCYSFCATLNLLNLIYCQQNPLNVNHWSFELKNLFTQTDNTQNYADYLFF